MLPFATPTAMTDLARHGQALPIAARGVSSATGAGDALGDRVHAAAQARHDMSRHDAVLV